MTPRDRIRELRRGRERNRLLRFSLVCLAVLLLCAWSSESLQLRQLFSRERMLRGLEFLTSEWVPVPLRERAFDGEVFWAWLFEFGGERLWPAVRTTVPIALTAIVLAFSASLPVAACGALAPGERVSTLRRAVAWFVRAAAIVLRAVPEYVLAFLFLALFGVSAWPAVLALAVHNAGIFTRLGAEALEDVSPRPRRALWASGAHESGLLLTSVLPLAFRRLLVYFFYRMETCLRESTVLGLLGIVSLGYFVEDARAHQRYDELLLLVLLAAALFAIADLASTRARAWLESGS